MLDSFRKGQRWLTLIFVSVIGLVFVFFLGVGGGFGPSAPTGTTVVQLDDTKLTTRDLARVRAGTEARLRQQLGEAYDQLAAGRFLDSQALAALVNTAVLAAAAQEMGLHVTRDELRRVVQASPAFIDADGRFDPEAFDRFAAYEYGSQRAFIQNFTRELLGQKLVELLVGQTAISDAEIDLQTRYDLEEVRIGYVALDTRILPEDEVLDEAEILAWADAHDEELRALFEARAPDLSEPERVRARHILILVPPDATPEGEAEARARAEAARLRVIGGEDFASVAREVSEDLTTAPNGGDLGLFAAGENDPAVDAAAFALEPGGLSDVVRSGHGFHVIRVEEKIAAAPASFEANRLALAAAEAAREKARERAERISQALSDAIRAGTSLEEAARAEGLSLERSPGLKRRPDGNIPGLGAAPDLLTTAFTLDAGESSPEIFPVGERRVLFQVLEHSRPDPETVAAERNARRERALAEKQNRLLQIWIDDYRRQLEAAGRLRVNAETALGT